MLNATGSKIRTLVTFSPSLDIKLDSRPVSETIFYKREDAWIQDIFPQYLLRPYRSLPQPSWGTSNMGKFKWVGHIFYTVRSACFCLSHTVPLKVWLQGHSPEFDCPYFWATAVSGGLICRYSSQWVQVWIIEGFYLSSFLIAQGDTVA